MQMQQLYQEIILDHHKHPHHAGLRTPFGAEVHHVNPTCGDEVTVRVHLEGDGREAKVLDVSYDAMGCSISQASTSVMTDLVIDRTLGEALDVLGEFTTMMTSRGTLEGDEDVIGDGIAFAGVSKYPARVKCALLGWMAFKDAAAQSVANGTAAAQSVANGTAAAQSVAHGTAAAQSVANGTAAQSVAYGSAAAQAAMAEEST